MHPHSNGMDLYVNGEEKQIPPINTDIHVAVWDQSRMATYSVRVTYEGVVIDIIREGEVTQSFAVSFFDLDNSEE